MPWQGHQEQGEGEGDGIGQGEGEGEGDGIGRGEGEGEGQGLEHWGHWSSVMKLYSGPIGLSPAQLAVHVPAGAIISQVTPKLRKTWQNACTLVIPAYMLLSQKSGPEPEPCSCVSLRSMWSRTSSCTRLPETASGPEPCSPEPGSVICSHQHVVS